MFSALILGAWIAAAPAQSSELSAEAEAVRALFEDQCTMCHDGSGDPSTPDGLSLDGSLGHLLESKSAATGKPLVVAGRVDQSYLWAKLVGGEIDGDVMPMGEMLPAEDLELVKAWIEALPSEQPAEGDAPDAPPPADEAPAAVAIPKRPLQAPFRGTRQGVQPTTTTLGRNAMMFRIDHRFGRIGTERGAFGLDAGVVMSLGLSYGILGGWDVEVRRSNSNKAWEIGTKYVPLRQEDGAPLSVGGHASLDILRAFDVANPVSGNVTAMASRLW